MEGNHSTRLILWYPISDFFYETLSGIEFICFYENDFRISDLKRRCFQNHDTLCLQRVSEISILSEIVLLCCLCKCVCYNFMRVVMICLKHLYDRTLDVSIMKRNWCIFLQEFFIRWQIVIVSKSEASFL